MDIARIRGIEDPVKRAIAVGQIFEQMPDLQAELRQIRQTAVNQLREAGWSYAEIGERLGLNRHRVAQIAKGWRGGQAPGEEDG